MILLLAGLALWWLTHLFPMVAPGRRAVMAARFGEARWKGGFALVTVGAVFLMVAGYRWADHSQVYLPPAWGIHLNNLLMILAVFLVGARDAKGRARQLIRHPMLWSVVLWAAAHLMVRGDLASVLLFGGLGAWAVVAMLATNARDGAWQRPTGGTPKGDLRHVAVTVAVLAVIVLAHWQLFGYRPFPG